jgi:hypothetical protein
LHQSIHIKIALNTPPTVKINISNIAPETLATLCFDFLGFGAKNAQFIILIENP